MRVVLDSNILIAALLKPQGAMGPLLDALRDERFIALYSEETFDELVDVLSRPWLRNKYGVRESNIEALLKLLLLRGERVRPEREIRACRDPKDDKFLEVAVAGEADLVVTGDDDLLALHPFEEIEILPPARFRERLEDPAAGAI